MKNDIFFIVIITILSSCKINQKIAKIVETKKDLIFFLSCLMIIPNKLGGFMEAYYVKLSENADNLQKEIKEITKG